MLSQSLKQYRAEQEEIRSSPSPNQLAPIAKGKAHVFATSGEIRRYEPYRTPPKMEVAESRTGKAPEPLPKSRST